MTEKISPEERLLRLIKRGTKKTVPPKSAQKIKKPIIPLFTFKRFLHVRFLNNLLLFLLFLALIYLALNLFMPYKPGEIEAPSLPSKQEEIKKDLLLQTQSYDYYAQQIGRRQLFRPAIGRKEKSVSKTKTLREIMQDFTLLGIMRGDNPQAVIEDKKAQKTYFLNRGDYLGEVQISDIQEGRVILEYEGESFDLFL